MTRAKLAFAVWAATAVSVGSQAVPLAQADGFQAASASSVNTPLNASTGNPVAQFGDSGFRPLPRRASRPTEPSPIQSSGWNVRFRRSKHVSTSPQGNEATLASDSQSADSLSSGSQASSETVARPEVSQLRGSIPQVRKVSGVTNHGGGMQVRRASVPAELDKRGGYAQATYTQDGFALPQVDGLGAVAPLGEDAPAAMVAPANPIRSEQQPGLGLPPNEPAKLPEPILGPDENFFPDLAGEENGEKLNAPADKPSDSVRNQLQSQSPDSPSPQPPPQPLRLNQDQSQSVPSPEPLPVPQGPDAGVDSPSDATAANPFGGYDSSQMQRQGGLTCDEFRAKIAEQTINRVSLDISPPFRPDVLLQSVYEKKKAEFDSRQTTRTWRGIDGVPVGEGRLQDIAYEKVLIQTDHDTIEELSIHNLSEGDLAYISANWGLPKECLIEQVAFTPRNWSPTTMTWKASNLCHKPLYFEDVNLERYGHTAGPVLQPVLSTAHFFGSVVVLPYKMGVHQPCECQYALGYYRPGNCAPWIVPPVPISLRGGLSQAAAVTGAFWLIP